MRKAVLILLAILVLGFILRVVPILGYNFPFTSDQGRDMLELRSLVIGHHLTLIGPITDVIGLYLGPFWYYFNIIPFLLGRGDPAFLVYWLIACYLLVGFLWWWVYRKEDRYFGLITSLLFLTLPGYLYISRYALNSNLLPIFLSIYFFLLVSLVKKPKESNIFLLGLASEISLQLEAAFSISLLPFAVLVFLITRQKVRNYLFLLSGFVLTLIPQLIFEFRHHFQMSKALVDALEGKTSYLIDRFPLFISTYESHRTSFLGVIDGLFGINPIISRLVMLSIFFFLGLKVRERFRDNLKLKDLNVDEIYFFISSLFIILLFAGYLFYNHPLKSWFLDGLYLPFVLIVSSFLTFLAKKSQILKQFVVVLLLLLTANFIFSQLNFLHFGQQYHSRDKSDLGNQIEAIDTAYKISQGKSFKAYNYTSSVYDFTYQYLYWWYGTKKYGYQPSSITYLDNVPEYIESNSSYLTKTKPLTIYSPDILIIEKEDSLQERRYAWLGNFVSLCLTSEVKLSSETIIQERVNCDTHPTTIKSSI